jgi:hypothetical protein
MKNFLSTLTLVIFALTAQAQLMGSFTTSIEGGVKGTANEFTPQIELYSLSGNNDLNTLIFNEENVADEATITISTEDENVNFENFTNILTASSDVLLRVGHKINGVKSRNASSITGWFGDNADFVGEDISFITVSYTKVAINTVDNWTSFSYELTVEIHGNQSQDLVNANK